MIALLVPITESISSSITMKTVHNRGTSEARRELQVLAIGDGGGVSLVWSTAGTAFTVDESVERFVNGAMKVRDEV